MPLSLELLGLSPETEGKEEPINVFEISHNPRVEKHYKGEELLELFNPKTDLSQEKLEAIKGLTSELDITHKCLTLGNEMGKLGSVILSNCLPPQYVEELREQNRIKFIDMVKFWDIVRGFKHLNPSVTLISYYFWFEQLYENDFANVIGHNTAKQDCIKWFDVTSKDRITTPYQLEQFMYVLTLATLVAKQPLLPPNSEIANRLRELILKSVSKGGIFLDENHWASGNSPALTALFSQKVLFPDDFNKNDLEKIYTDSFIDGYLNNALYRHSEDLHNLFLHGALCGTVGLNLKFEEKDTFAPKIPAIRKF